MTKHVPNQIQGTFKKLLACTVADSMVVGGGSVEVPRNGVRGGELCSLVAWLHEEAAEVLVGGDEVPGTSPDILTPPGRL